MKCINCGYEMIMECHNPFCKMNKPKLNKYTTRFLKSLESPSIDNFIENQVNASIEEKHNRIDAQIDSELSDYMENYWKGE